MLSCECLFSCLFNDLLACIAGRHPTTQVTGKGTGKGKGNSRKNMASATTTQAQAEPAEATAKGQGAKRVEDREKKLQQKCKSSHAGEKLKQWEECDMKEALHIGLDLKKAGKEVSTRQLSEDYDVPYTTLRDRIISGNPDNYKHTCGGKGRTVLKVDKGMFKVCW